MKTFTEQIVIALQQVHHELLEAEELVHPESTELVSINHLRRPPYSKRVPIPNLLKTLVKSLHEFDFIGGIIINGKNNHVIDGWHRLEIWKNMGKETIPCFILDVDPDQERKLHLSLNRHLAQFDAADFGFTNEFAGVNLIADYGFSKTDLMPGELESKKIGEMKRSNITGSKLITSLPEPYFLKMEKLKKHMPAPNKSKVLIKLIDFYETHQGRIY